MKDTDFDQAVDMLYTRLQPMPDEADTQALLDEFLAMIRNVTGVPYTELQGASTGLPVQCEGVA